MVHRENLGLLDQKQLLLGDVLAVLVGQILAASGEELPEGGDAFEGG